MEFDENKLNELLKVSDPDEVNKRAMKIYGKNVFLSTRKNKKYMILDDNNKFIHFGDVRYHDFTSHRNVGRAMRYRKRMENIKGDWRDNEYSPNILSLRLTW